MKKEKRNYLKPQTSVMNIQTEGVIAVSGDSGVIDKDKFCESGCFDGSKNCGCYLSNNNCNNLEEGKTYCTTLHCNPSSGTNFSKIAIHYQLLPNNMISYAPCDKKK